VIDDLVVGIEPLASAENVNVEYEIAMHGARVQGNRAQLLRALHNIVSNAIQAVAPDDGTIRVNCRCEGPEASIEVADNGVGMTPDVLDHLFDPYFTTKPEGEGTGLGTVIAKKVIEEHNGSIDVKSEPGKGTTVAIRLPLMDDACRPAPTVMA
jgi:signal transduction histidine kinase